MNNYYNFRGLDKSLRLQKIVDVSINLFHKKGYRTTTLDDVSKELGITKAALYHYVSSKENLLSIIFIQALENIFKNTHKINLMNISPDKKLRLMIKNHVKDIIIKSLPLLSVFFSEENQLSEESYKKMQTEKKKYTDIIENVLKDGVKQGLFRKIDTRLMSYGIIGMCNWILKWYKSGVTKYKPEEIADHFVNFLEKGYINTGKTDDKDNPPTFKTINDDYNPLTKGNALKTIKTQCKALIDLIEQVETA